MAGLKLWRAMAATRFGVVVYRVRSGGGVPLAWDLPPGCWGCYPFGIETGSA